jgi:hypothetical protein
MRMKETMKQLHIIIALLIFITLTSLRCKDDGTNPPDVPISLSIDDVSCTEVYLRLKLGSSLPNREVTLKRDTTVLFTKQINETETVWTDTSLLPNHRYTYSAIGNSITQKCIATTMDTTSHDFTWQTVTLGDEASSSLYDVAIINDTLAYAVGQIYLSGDPIPYCLAQWNGSKWQLKRLYCYFPDYQSTLPLYSANGIYAFNETDIWLTPGSVFHWNGKDTLTEFSFNRMTLPDANATVVKLWGSSSSDLYGSGNAGTIVHYNGTSWKKLESGTGLNITDIFGNPNEKTGGIEILAIANQLYVNDERKILQISGNTIVPLPDNPIQEPLNSIWFIPGRHYYAVGSGIYEKHTLSDAQWKNKPLDFTPYYSFGIDGNDINDIAVVGGCGDVLHFNGKTWKSYYSQTQFGGNYYAVKIKGDICIAVGSNSVIVVGKRIN